MTTGALSPDGVFLCVCVCVCVCVCRWLVQEGLLKKNLSLYVNINSVTNKTRCCILCLYVFIQP